MTAPLKLVYRGRRLATTGTLVYVYADDEGKILTWKKPLLVGARVGAQLDCTESEPGSGSVYTGGEHRPTISDYLDGDLVAEWEAIDRADSTLHAQRAREAKTNRSHVTPLDRAVSDLREAAAGMNRPQRAAFIAYLIAELS